MRWDLVDEEGGTLAAAGAARSGGGERRRIVRHGVRTISSESAYLFHPGVVCAAVGGVAQPVDVGGGDGQQGAAADRGEVRVESADGRGDAVGVRHGEAPAHRGRLDAEREGEGRGGGRGQVGGPPYGGGDPPAYVPDVAAPGRPKMRPEIRLTLSGRDRWV